MVDDCDEFYFVEIGDSCAAIALEHGISLSQLRDWNPSVGTDCSGLWANSYVCVSVVDHNPGTTTKTTTTTPPAPTTPPNGIETPLPIQPCMVDNCDAFHFVQQGEACTIIAATHKISLTQFTTWNPTVGSTCNGIWANAYVCVNIIGHTPNAITTTTITIVPPLTTTALGPSPT
jgi:hypothetical protein